MKGRKIDTAALAAQIRRDAIRYARQFDTHDATCARDVRDLNAVADMVERGELARAYRRWAGMDTAAREGLSQRAWRGLTRGRAVGHEDDP